MKKAFALFFNFLLEERRCPAPVGKGVSEPLLKLPARKHLFGLAFIRSYDYFNLTDTQLPSGNFIGRAAIFLRLTIGQAQKVPVRSGRSSSPPLYRLAC
jgi:hypothetical protein